MTSTKFNISEAGRVVGKSRATIQRAIKAGTISVTRDGDKKWIDASELIRAFGNDVDFSRLDKKSSNKDSKRSEIGHLQTASKLEAMQEQLVTQYKGEVERLSQALERAQDGQAKVTLLLEQQSETKSDWDQQLEAMSKKLANQADAKIEALQAKHYEQLKKYQHALKSERSKTFWRRWFG